MTLLTLDGVGKRFANGVQALSGLTFEVREGEFVSLLGPSGCGKSTALRLIAGLIAARQRHDRSERVRPELGFVFQEPTLMPWATTLANARLPLDLKKIPRDEAKAAPPHALARLGLEDFLHAYPRELSGGMKMRVSIARALGGFAPGAVDGRALRRLDEPTRQSLNDDLLALSREDGITVIFVTHSVIGSQLSLEPRAGNIPRPGRIKAEIALPPGPRDRLSHAFAESQAHVAAALLEAA